MDELQRDTRDRIGILTLNRPTKRNALTPDLITELARCVRGLLDDPSIGAIVLTGAPPAFCAGMDLNIVLQQRGDEAQRRATIDHLLDLYGCLWDASKPVIAAVNGSAVAGGAGLVTACDVAIAAESARIGYPEVRHGLVAGVVMAFLTRCVGDKMARYLLLTGELLTGPAALSAGLVSECVPDDRCLPRALELADRMAAFPPGAYAETKRVLREVGPLDPVAHSSAVRSKLTRLCVRDETAAALEQFLRRC